LPFLKKIFQNRQLNWVIKTLVFGLVIWILYRQVFLRDNIEELYAAFRQNFTKVQLPWLVAAIVLMPVNWLLETCKWRVLIRNFSELSFGESFKAVWAGVTFSIFTPNRVGAFGGRILFVKPENNWKAIIATVVGSISQMLVLLGMGFLGLIWFASSHLQLDAIVLRSTFLLGLVMVGLLIFGFFNVDLIIPLAKRLPLVHHLRRFTKDLVVLRSYSSAELSQALGFAFLRYLTYCLQYYLLLRFFGIEVPLLAALAGIATIYLLQTSLPVMPLLGIFARVEIALFVWGIFSENDLSILASTFGLWILNVVTPALIGTVLIANINVLKSLGYESEDA
ncbi:MAG: lysylphosphatidylglycerol synthase transmembrane domain-containing protein, partial [Bacteroidota bacterium]